MRILSCLSLVLLLATPTYAGTIEVGPGHSAKTLAEGFAKAKAGDTVRVHPSPDDYKGQGVLVRTPRLTVTGVPADAKTAARVTIAGGTFNYSGGGSIPRGIFQFDPQASDCILENFELTGAHNESHNGAGVRVNAANNVTVRNCTIRGNDMGIMSNGELAKKTGENFCIENCLITGNGAKEDPGYNHNLYLGGTSVRLINCEISKALTGHNLKSRAHLTWVEACYIHDSANREVDLVDAAGNTDVEESDAVILGTAIVKASNMNGNKTVIHFGQDGKKEHDGTLYIVHSTILTPYQSPVVDLSAARATARIYNSLIADPSARGAKHSLIETRNGAKVDLANVRGNVLAGGFSSEGNTMVGKLDFPDIARASFGVAKGVGGHGQSVALEKLELPAVPGGRGKITLSRFASTEAKARTDGAPGAWEPRD